MTDSTLLPAYTDVTNPPREHYLQPAVAGRENPFKNFDWGDHLITWPQDAEMGTIASSHPSDLPWKFVSNTSLPPRKGWEIGIMGEVTKLVMASKLTECLVTHHTIARGEEGTVCDLIHVGIDVSIPVVKADAEEFVKRCSEMLATHNLEDTIVKVNHTRIWGAFAPAGRR